MIKLCQKNYPNLILTNQLKLQYDFSLYLSTYIPESMEKLCNWAQLFLVVYMQLCLYFDDLYP